MSMIDTVYTTFTHLQRLVVEKINEKKCTRKKTKLNHDTTNQVSE